MREYRYSKSLAHRATALSLPNPTDSAAVLARHDAYRVPMTGIHLLRTGEAHANVQRLNEYFRLPFLDDLVASKVAEQAEIADLDWSFHAARLDELERMLEAVFAESTLPQDRDREAVNDFLVELRLA